MNRYKKVAHYPAVPVVCRRLCGYLSQSLRDHPTRNPVAKGKFVAHFGATHRNFGLGAFLSTVSLRRTGRTQTTLTYFRYLDSLPRNASVKPRYPVKFQ